MKFSLTISDLTKEELNAIMSGNPPGIAGLGSTSVGALHANGAISAATSAVPMPQNGGAPSNDDEGPANANAPAVDAAGLPWDDRIHSKNKAMNADQTWRKRRNVDTGLVASVEAELRQRMTQQPAPQMMQQPAPQMTLQPAPNFVPPMPDQMMQQPAPQMMQQPAPQMMQQPAPQMMQQPVMQQPGPMDFNAFMTHLAGQMAKRDASGAPLITTDYLASVAQRLSAQFGRQFNSITEIATFPDVIAMAVNVITLDGRWS